MNLYFAFITIILQTLLFNNSSALNADDLGTVIFTNILFRHGDRTPVEPYPNDPHKNESEWPVPFGQLTPIGMHQHLILGRWLRSRYRHLISDEYSLHDIYVKSTDVDRTLMSAEANLAGIYPPKGNQIWDSIKWMPIPVHTTLENEDNLLAGKKSCPRYNYELKKLLNSSTFQKINRQNAQLFEYLSKNVGKKINSLQELEFIYNILWIENLYNKTLPEWTKSVYPERMVPLVYLSFTTSAYNKILQRLKIGLLLGEMVRHMILKSEDFLQPNRKIYMYSAHDETVANFLMALNLFEPHCPPYAATVLIELRLNLQNQHIVTVSYKNSSDEPTLLTLPGCNIACPLEEFIGLTKDIIPDDWEKECQMDLDDNNLNMNISVIMMILTSAMLMLIVVVFLIIIFVCWHYKRNYNQYYLRLSTDPI
ncbi:hypothetical protein PV327_008980 [Microctonus hyperodae]|uniref:acid phosphatase n=1 Tax=Microctonus hyperodae TaxID=165561 RepID=A0AA39FT90_MICHY|nr:hypothetical protein PV327_008980 [Microctonus hyperodae]